MKKIVTVVAAVAALSAFATQYSKLAIVTAAKQAGKWETLKAFVAANGLEDEWLAASYISDDYPVFIAATNAVVASGVASAAEVAAFLEASRDFAVPDELFARYYARQMSNDTERVKWHGSVVGTPSYDKVAQTKTTRYADGFVFVQPFRGAVPRSIDDRISAAERKARAEAAAKARAEAEAKRKADRIAMLQTNLTAEVSALMARKRWPEQLARLYLQQELNELIGTVEVSAEVRPQGD